MHWLETQSTGAFSKIVPDYTRGTGRLFPPPTAAIRMGVTGRVPTWVAYGDPLETVRPSRLPTRGCRRRARDPQPWPWPSHRRSPAAIPPFLAPRLVKIRINWLYMSLLSGCRTIGHQCLPEKVTCINRAQLLKLELEFPLKEGCDARQNLK